MLKAFFTIDEEDKELPDKTDIDWLDTALALAQRIIQQILNDIERGRMAESGKALVLKTGEAKSYVGSNPTSSATE